MIQELFGGSNAGVIGDRSQLSTPPFGGGILDRGSTSPSPSSSSATVAAAAASTKSENNLRCPRCDSSNTKFCYYNNYNLTQPRHFCKTCRRYWTKGGTLRNVPIGGGCRKSKTTVIAAAVGKSTAYEKFKTSPPEIGKTGPFGGFEHGESLSSNPILWASSQNPNFLSSIRGNHHTPNPNYQFTNSLSTKEEPSPFGSRAFGPAHLPSMGISNPSYRNQTLNSQGLILQGEVQNHGLQEVYHRLRTASYCYPDQHAPVILGNMASATSSTSAILESAPVAAGELAFWNSNIPWPADFPTINGAFP